MQHKKDTEPKMNTKLILALCTSLLAIPAIAADWQPLASEKGQSAQLDFSSIQVDGDEVQVKVRRDYAESQLNVLEGRWFSFRSKVVTYVVDCADQKLAYLQWTLHASGQGRGRVVQSGEAGAVLQSQGPSELGDGLLIERVCTKVAQMQITNTLLAESNQ
jgi:hypothetical protein